MSATTIPVLVRLPAPADARALICRQIKDLICVSAVAIVTSVIAAGCSSGNANSAPGNRAEMRACLDATSVLAAPLDRDNSGATVRLRTPVEAMNRAEPTMLGVTVMSNPNTVYQNGLKEFIDVDKLFSLVSIDSGALANGSYDGASILASKLLLRECEGNCPQRAK